MRKKHEIVEAVVLSVCEAFEIYDWRKLHKKTNNKISTAAKYAITNLLSSEIGCSFQDIHFYFRMYNSLSTYSAGQCRFMDELELPSLKMKYLNAKELVSKYFLLKP